MLLGLLFWQVDVGEVGRAFLGVRAGWIAAAWGVYGLALLLKVLRWWTILRAVPHPEPADDPARRWLVADALFVGFFGNYVLPARIGELARSVLYARRSGIGLGASLTTVAVGRLFDAFTLAVLFFVAVEVLPLPTDLPAWLPLAARAVGGLAAGLLVALAFGERWLPTEPPPGREGLLGRALDAAQSLGRSVRDGLAVLRSGRHALGAFGVSAALWILEAVAFLLLMRGFDHALPTIAGALQTVAASYASAAPAAPGSLGVHQWVTILVLDPFGVPEATAAAASLLMTAFVLTWTVPLGLFGLWRQGTSLRRLRAMTEAAA